MGLLTQFKLSYQMTLAAARMTARHPESLLVAAGSLGVLALAAVVPLGTMLYLAFNDWDAFLFGMRYVFQFWFVEDAFESGGLEAGLGAFVTWLLAIYALWMTIVAFIGLFTSTIIMHTGVQQLRGQKPSLRDGFALARQNWLRLLGLAFFAGAVMGLLKRFSASLRVIPFVGRFVRGALIALLTGVLYASLPVVVYERKGAWSALKSTWTNVRKTWGGLVVGTGLMMSALWVGLWFVGMMVEGLVDSFFGVELGWGVLTVFQLFAAVALYSLNITLSANLRAALYLHVTEGHTGVLPEGVLVAKPAPAQPRQTTFELVHR